MTVIILRVDDEAVKVVRVLRFWRQSKGFTDGMNMGY